MAATFRCGTERRAFACITVQRIRGSLADPFAKLHKITKLPFRVSEADGFVVFVWSLKSNLTWNVKRSSLQSKGKMYASRRRDFFHTSQYLLRRTLSHCGVRLARQSLCAGLAAERESLTLPADVAPIIDSAGYTLPFTYCLFLLCSQRCPGGGPRPMILATERNPLLALTRNTAADSSLHCEVA